MSLSAIAQDHGLKEVPRNLSERDYAPVTGFRDYFIVPVERCQKLFKENKRLAKLLCAQNYLPKSFTHGSLKIINAENGLVRLSAYNSVEEDGKELLCYRCAFNKKKKEDCGRFETIWNNKKWAENCPQTK